MKISYNWLKEYIPQSPAFDIYINDVHKLADILTAVGLEVEHMESYESVPGGLSGLIVGEVLTCEKHPDADKLKITTVYTGSETLQIVCGAPNAAAGQKVVVAQVGTVLHPKDGEPFTIKKAKIRGVDSQGMLCAEDEIGIGKSHEGIIVLPDESKAGTPVAAIFPVYTDTIIEIGLTPNRMDAQSHLGVAKDICAWLSHHTGQKAQVISPIGRPFEVENNELDIEVCITDSNLAPRYSGVTISNVSIAPAPLWMQHKLKAIGVKPINNIVDITNFILHATGQPLHAFDADKIAGRQVKVETLPAGTTFTTLEGKERKLLADDIMICDGHDVPMCIAGVFGGVQSGVTTETKNIFLESAVFNPANIRKSMLAHGLRTDAAVRFEKGIDISKTLDVLKYAALLIKELGGGTISSSIRDKYQNPKTRILDFSLQYLKRLSGKNFQKEAVIQILESLNFSVKETNEEILSLVIPASNPDISIQADVVEEVLRISGLDAIEIPRQVTMTPGIGEHTDDFRLKDKITGWLTGQGFAEIFTNSISNKLYFEGSEGMVEIINSLSEGLNVLRPQMLPTALESIAYNLNRQNKSLFFFEFGKTYSGTAGQYTEKNHLSIYCTGEYQRKSWNQSPKASDIFFIKGIAEGLLALAGIHYESKSENDSGEIHFYSKERELGRAGIVPPEMLDRFSIKQPVFYLDLNYDLVSKLAQAKKTVYKQVSKFPVVSRDLSMIIDQAITYSAIKGNIDNLKLKTLSGFYIFDLYESDKLGAGKKSIAMSFSFSDAQKTLTDKETDKSMNQIIHSLEQTFNAQIRNHA